MAARTIPGRVAVRRKVARLNPIRRLAEFRAVPVREVTIPVRVAMTIASPREVAREVAVTPKAAGVVALDAVCIPVRPVGAAAPPLASVRGR
ncbi:MAG: hypothetical protein ABIZ81_16855 [Opitutaceae bacterium]